MNALLNCNSLEISGGTWFLIDGNPFEKEETQFVFVWASLPLRSHIIIHSHSIIYSLSGKNICSAAQNNGPN